MRATHRESGLDHGEFRNAVGIIGEREWGSIGPLGRNPPAQVVVDGGAVVRVDQTGGPQFGALVEVGDSGGVALMRVWASAAILAGPIRRDAKSASASWKELSA